MKGYAVTNWFEGKAQRIYAHRLIMKAPAGWEVDHINRNPLDNRRENLRLATHSQNGANKAHPNSASGYRGVYKASKNRWHARIKVDGRPLYLGSFGSPHDAARRFNEAAIEKYGEFAVLNEVPLEA